MGTQLRTLGDCARRIIRIELRCGFCGHSAEFRVANLIQHYGRDLSLAVMRRSFRCSICKRKGAAMRVVHPQPIRTWQDNSGKDTKP